MFSEMSPDEVLVETAHRHSYYGNGLVGSQYGGREAVNPWPSTKSRRDRSRKRMRTVNSLLKKIQQTPPWADLEAIEEVYNRAIAETARTGVKSSVDHIIPLTGDGVSGLHIAANLQVMDRKQNMRKGSKFTP